VPKATELLEFLQSIKRPGCQWTVTFDELWLYWETNWEQQWLPEDDEPGRRKGRGIDHDETMSTIVWNPNGFRLIDAMSEGEKYSSR
jgi:hypothetical protein